MRVTTALIATICSLASGFSLGGVRPTSLSRAAVSSTPCMCDGATIVKGVCKWFDVAKGFGFISRVDDDSDVFVHQSDIYAPGFRSLNEGEELEFKIATDPKSGKLKAVDVTGPDGAYVQGAPRQMYDDDY